MSRYKDTPDYRPEDDREYATDITVTCAVCGEEVPESDSTKTWDGATVCFEHEDEYYVNVVKEAGKEDVVAYGNEHKKDVLDYIEMNPELFTDNTDSKGSLEAWFAVWTRESLLDHAEDYAYWLGCRKRENGLEKPVSDKKGAA